ncbi:hypothetical protein K504DRAFT_471063 [Pleomassaria siparia CBS 279.74]|uniref:Uncharacterized protein n=1 Tax=Pleomassaria siparia CBS 279.74 TaxID=1314801 RepID=A0A6G1K0D0_9PLEO|nr:hypothetical protein K504DRAFT_471063 [Pleomassaria siparia CBS 279.74]
MSRAPGPIRQLWYNWKMKQLPWRSQWLIGFDLEGNTFWEFKDALNAGRRRRIVKYARSTHYDDVKVPPQWMQWLRHTRYEPPTLAEQQADIYRQQQMKTLAAQADARWAAKPSFLDAPDKQQPAHMLQSKHPNAGIRPAAVDQDTRNNVQPPRVTKESEDVIEESEPSHGAPALRTRKLRGEPKAKDSPWKQSTSGNPGEQWQPESWTPGPVKRRP